VHRIRYIQILNQLTGETCYEKRNAFSSEFHFRSSWSCSTLYSSSKTHFETTVQRQTGIRTCRINQAQKWFMCQKDIQQLSNFRESRCFKLDNFGQFLSLLNYIISQKQLLQRKWTECYNKSFGYNSKNLCSGLIDSRFCNALRMNPYVLKRLLPIEFPLSEKLLSPQSGGMSPPC